ncbi:transporter substrate-binding domain-containing protein [Thalassomonas viridans]|uniref:Transporter substrate-binding domain-containing protein n=1 Tax=Thalassomonas viridans TaxID=137584 RepID=A0AAF0CCK0_9GAMM|nr:transporter substrate-binding domain-containing protein [Thalassomonas viridans]WDE07439.1 transporter substrate-binding domain-containing protein [Thalassomonas viridans]
MNKLYCLLGFLLIITVSAQATAIADSYEFASIEYLSEQELGRIVLPQIYQSLGIDITITPLPADRAQYVATSGKKDGEIMRIWTYGDENSTTIRVPTPYYYLETMPFVLKQGDIDISKAQDLENYSLVKVRGVKHTNNITAGLNRVYEVNSSEVMFKLLSSGKVDVALTNTLDGNLALERLGYKNIVAMDKPLAVLPLYHYVHEKHQALVPVIDQAIQRLKSSGELQKLIEKAEKQIIQDKGLYLRH